MPATVTVTRVGADGDGVAVLPDGTPVYIPLTLPGERVLARPQARHGSGWLAEADSILAASPSRIAPFCRHFGVCGGCVLQHWDLAGYQDWKAGLVETALRRAGFPSPPVAPLIPGQPGERRRMDLAARRMPGNARVGLHRLRGAEVTDLTECAVLHPRLFALVPLLRRLLQRLEGLRREASVIANLLDTGPDLLLLTDAPLSLADRAALTDFAHGQELPRIAWARGDDSPEPVCVFRPPIVTLSGVPVTPPPGAFLQATSRGEAAIVAAVFAGLPPKLPLRARIAELYGGCGTLTFSLAQRARVAVWDGNAAAVAALRQAVNQSGLSGRVEAMERDLGRQPLMAREFAGFAAVVLDPPHAGAGAQIEQIVAANVPVVIYVSCNPAALARDARMLCAAGYGLQDVVPIDQFLWSARVEAVCTFRRTQRAGAGDASAAG